MNSPTCGRCLALGLLGGLLEKSHTAAQSRATTVQMMYGTSDDVCHSPVPGRILLVEQGQVHDHG